MIDLLKIVVPFLLGLIPFIITFRNTRKINEENTKQQFRIKFYDKQLEVLVQLDRLITTFHSSFHHKYYFFGVSQDWLKNKNTKDSETLQEMYKDSNSKLVDNLKAIVNFLEFNDTLLPSELIRLSTEYMVFGKKYLAYDILKDSDVGKDYLKLVQTKEEFMELWQNQNTLFNTIKFIIRLLIGVEANSNSILSKLHKDIENHRYISTNYGLE